MYDLAELFPLFFLLTALGQAAMAFFAWNRRGRAPATVPFGILALCSAVFSFGLFLQLRAESMPWLRMGLHVSYLGMPWLPGLWLLVALAQTGRPWKSRSWLLLAFLIPSLAFLAHHTNDWHHLYYRALSIEQQGPRPVLVHTYGPAFWVFAFYFHLVVAFCLGFLGWEARRARGFRRRQLVAMALASLLPWVGSFLHVGGAGLSYLEAEAASVALAVLLLGYGILRLKFFDLRPVAREQVFLGMRDAVVVADGAGHIVDYNPAMAALFPGLCRGDAVREAFAPWPDLVKALLGEAEPRRITLTRAEELRRHLVNVFHVPGQGGDEGGWAVVLADQTDVHRAMDELRKLATTDALTGASNRRHFQEHLELAFHRAARQRSPVSLIAIDLDHFKRVNDERGHAAGDAVLQVTVARIFACLRDVDMLGRLGGEEFAALLEGTSLEGALAVAERIRAHIARAPVSWRGEEINITASLGVATFPGGPGGDPQEVLRRADMALYRAKGDGRNRVCG